MSIAMQKMLEELKAEISPNKIESIISSLKSIFLYSWLIPLVSFYDNIKRLIAWFPVIWEDRDFDYAFLFAIMQFKISNMRKLHEETRRFVNSDKVIKQLLTCEELLKRLQKDEYCAKDYEEHDDKYGRLNMTFGEITERNTRRCMFERNKVLTEKDKERETKDFKRIANKEIYMYKQDIELLLNTIKKYHRKWWE